MSTIHYINECKILKVSELKYGVEPNQNFRRKPKSDETILKERVDKGYVSKRNTCKVCYELKSRTGKCSCTE
jgi:hypothetical protein